MRPQNSIPSAIRHLGPWSPRRKLTLTLRLLGLLAGLLPLPLPAQEPPPLNVIVVLVDDLGWTDLGCYGSEYYDTPNIDRLAAEGTRFTNAYAACAVCSPTRAAVLTGRHPGRSRVTDWIRWRDPLPRDGKNPSGFTARADQRLSCPENALFMEHAEVTLAEVLGPAGYATAHIGKWHLGPRDWYPERQGFQINVGGCHLGQPPSYFDPYYRERDGNIPTLPARQAGEYLTDREGDEAVAFLEEHRERPFFLYYAPYAVHTPIQGKPDLVERYKRKPATHQRDAAYAAMLSSLDDSVGKILETLSRLDIAKQTLILFTSDNGGLRPVTSNAPLRAGKGYPYEGGIRVPLIVRWPGITEPGSVSQEPVTSVDYFPTILEATRVPLPTERSLDGASLLAHLKSGRPSRLRRNLFWHFPHYRDAIPPYSIVRSGDWKLIHFWEGPKLELYNLASDVGETKNVAETLPEKRDELLRKLNIHLEAIGATRPRPNEAAGKSKVFESPQGTIEAAVTFVEGPAWHPTGNVYFSDTAGNRILRRDSKGQLHVFRTPSGRANGLLFDRKGRLLACEGPGEGGNLRVTRTELDGSVTILTDNYQGKRYNGPNDLALDTRNRIYFTDPRYGNRRGMEQLDDSGRTIEGVYRIDPSGQIERIITHEVDRPNGIAVSADDKYLFVVDNQNTTARAARKLWRFDLTPAGKIAPGSRKSLFDFGKGRGGDGIALDRKGRIYVAGGNEVATKTETAAARAGIYVVSPTGEAVDFLPVPYDLVTNCTFGDKDLRTLYVTAGHRLLSVRVDTPGYLAWPNPR